MATINHTTETDLERGYVKVEWDGMSTDDDGDAFSCAGLRLVSAQYWGNFNGGTGKITIMASNQLSPSDYSEFIYSFSAKTYAYSPKFYAEHFFAEYDPDYVNFVVGSVKPVADANFISGGVALLFVPRAVLF